MFANFRGLPRLAGMRALAIWLAVGFVFAVPWENAVHVAGIGRISKLLGAAAFLVWALSVIARGRLRHPDAFQKAFFVFVIWSGLSLYWSVDSGATVSGFTTYALLFGLALMFWDLFDGAPLIRGVLQAYVFGAFVASGSVIVNFLTEPRARFEEHERINALGYETDGIALVVAIAAPAAWYLAAGAGGHGAPFLCRFVNYAYVPVGLFAMVMTGTRGATLASIPTVVYILWSLLHARGRNRMVAVIALVAAFVLVVEFAPRGPLDRIGTASTVAQAGDGALGNRWYIWKESSRLILEHPLQGVGLDAHRAAVAPEIGQESAYKKAGKEAHNTYLSVMAETGIVGFLLFAAVLVTVVNRIRGGAAEESGYWFAQLGVLAIGAMSLSLEDSKSVWILLSLAVASAAAPERQALSRPALSITYPAVRLGLPEK